MKKILFSLFSLLFVWLGFCCANYEPTVYNSTMIYQLNSSNNYEITIDLTWYDLLCLGCYSATSCKMLWVEINSVVYNHHMTNWGAISCTNLTWQFHFYKSGSSSWNIPLYWITLNYPANSCPTCSQYELMLYDTATDNISFSNITDNILLAYSSFSDNLYTQPFDFNSKSYSWYQLIVNWNNYMRRSDLANACVNSWYILSSSVNSAYCTWNNLCPVCSACDYSSYESQINLLSWSLNNCSNNLSTCQLSLSSCLSANCPTNTWDVSRSALYINDIQHLWKPIINITIPEEIDWDYINSWDSFDLDVVWYNVDYEAMSETLSVQKYRPTSEDFTRVVSILAPYMKILLFLLFAYIVIKRLKKPFSSKLK